MYIIKNKSLFCLTNYKCGHDKSLYEKLFSYVYIIIKNIRSLKQTTCFKPLYMHRSKTMADEEDPWGFDEGDTTDQPVVQDTSITEAAAPPNINEKADAEETLKNEESQVAQPPPEDDGYRKPVQLYRHWVRPQFLQYKYMYNYRTNYYNDVIDYLDKKQSGLDRDIPRPQTWAERVLRSNTSGRLPDRYLPSSKKDKHLIQTLAASIRPYNYHTKAYINQKYSHVL